jgi:hypothetical protein
LILPIRPLSSLLSCRIPASLALAIGIGSDAQGDSKIGGDIIVLTSGPRKRSIEKYRENGMLVEEGGAVIEVVGCVGVGSGCDTNKERGWSRGGGRNI